MRVSGGVRASVYGCVIIIIYSYRLMVFSHQSKTTRQDNDKTNVEPVHSYDAFHTRHVGPGGPPFLVIITQNCKKKWLPSNHLQPASYLLKLNLTDVHLYIYGKGVPRFFLVFM